MPKRGQLLDFYVLVAVPYNFCATLTMLTAITYTCNLIFVCVILCTILEHAMTEMRFK